jgi:hypothetical protein
MSVGVLENYKLKTVRDQVYLQQDKRKFIWISVCLFAAE